jgi:hypothetical protein
MEAEKGQTEEEIRAEEEHMQELSSLFGSFDRNGDGNVSKKEMLKSLKKNESDFHKILGLKARSNKGKQSRAVARFFKGADDDGDSQLDFEEFLTAVKAVEEEAAAEEEEKKKEEEEVVTRKIQRSTYAFGRNSFGQLGVGHFRPAPNPTILARSTPNFHFECISSGEAHTVARGSDGFYYGWGDNSCGQLGFHHHDFNRKVDHEVEVDFIATTRFGAPTLLEKLNHLDPTNVVCGQYHSLALVPKRGKGAVVSFGKNDCGQLGNYFDDLSDHDIPAVIPDLLPVSSRDQDVDPHRLPEEAVQDGFHHMAAGVGTSYVWKVTSLDSNVAEAKAKEDAAVAARAAVGVTEQCQTQLVTGGVVAS